MRKSGTWIPVLLAGAVFLLGIQCALAAEVTSNNPDIPTEWGQGNVGTATGPVTIHNGSVWQYRTWTNTFPEPDQIYNGWHNIGSLTNYDTVNLTGSGNITGTPGSMSGAAANNTLNIHDNGSVVAGLTMQGTTSNRLLMDSPGASITGNIVMNTGAGDIDITGGSVSGSITTNAAGSDWLITDTAGTTTISGALTSNGGDSVITVQGTPVMQGGSTITMSNGGNTLNLNLGSGTVNEATKSPVNSVITLAGDGNTLNVGYNTEITNTTNITMTGDGTTFNFHDWSRYDADWQNIGGNSHTLNIGEATDFAGTMNFTGSGITANIDLTEEITDGFDAPAMTGQIVFETVDASAGANTVNIKNGTLTNANGSVIASNVVDTAFNVSGGLSNLLVSGATAASTYRITGGDVYNIRQRTGDPLVFGGDSWTTGYLAQDAVDAGTILHDVIYGDGGQTDTTRFQSYSILNIDNLTTTSTGAGSTGAKTIVSIGEFYRGTVDADGDGLMDGASIADTILNQDNSMGQDAYGNQVTANSIDVEANSKLIIHADQTHLGQPNADIDPEEWSIANETRVAGELTLDRSSLHSSDPSITATINVETDGILYGFGENAYNFSGSYANHDDQYEQQRAQLYGNLTLNTGATLQPYDLGLSPDYFKGGLIDPTKADDGLFHGWDYDTFELEHRGSVFQVDTETGDLGGISTFMNGSGMRSRLFHGFDGREIVNLAGEANDDGSRDMDTQFSDSLLTVSTDFSAVFNYVNTHTGWDAQDNKVQYDPVFGFQYDLKSKQEFEIFRDEAFQDKTYYYAVVNSGNVIGELVDYDGANHLFDKLILKSDMLGKYDFLKSEDNRSVYLRYRQLAYHPTEGGIKRTMTEDAHGNEIVPGQYLDEIRYPFKGQPGSDLNSVLSDDPSSAPNPLDPADSYNEAGYNGDMVDFYYYATRAPGDPDYDATLYNPVFDNYRPEWIDDWANLFQGMQLDVADNRNLYRAVRMLHAETYANISQTAFDAMSQFTRNRERNAVSALFQVEKEFGGEACGEDLAEFDPRDFYVENPIRFWASAFGAHGDQSTNSGGQNELGYDNTVWGGSVGAIKELGDFYVGATIGYSDTTTKYYYADVRSRAYIAEALLGARIFCNGFAELYGSYSYNDNKNTRVVDLASEELGGYYGVATGDFASHVFSGGLRLGWQKTIGDNWLLLPAVGVNVMHHRAGAFTESGRWDMANRMDFTDGSMNRTTVRVPVEVRLNRAVALGDCMLMPEVRAGITPFFGDKRGEATAKWVGNPIDNRYFTSLGADRGDFEGWVGATVELSKKGRFYAAANYDYVYGNKYGAHNYSLQAGLNF